MLGLKRYLARQASRPSGFFGKLVAGKAFNKTNQTHEDMAVDMLPIEEDSQILEIGFGNGRLIHQISMHVDNGRVCGIELSDPMLKEAKKRNRTRIERGIVELKKGSVEEIPYDDNQFDIVLTLNSIYFWPDPEQNLKEVHRVLNENGQFYCGIRPKDQMEESSVIGDNRDIFKNLYTPDELREFLESGGFREVTVRQDENNPLDNVIAKAVK